MSDDEWNDPPLDGDDADVDELVLSGPLTLLVAIIVTVWLVLTSLTWPGAILAATIWAVGGVIRVAEVNHR